MFTPLPRLFCMQILRVLFVTTSMATGTVMADLAKDEQVIFFPTAAFMNDGQSHWHIPIHGWVFEPAKSRFRKRGIAKLIERKYGLSVTQESQPYFDSRVGYFLVDNERGKRLDIIIGNHSYSLNKSKPNGHFHTELIIPVHEVEELSLIHI